VFRNLPKAVKQMLHKLHKIVFIFLDGTHLCSSLVYQLIFSYARELGVYELVSC